MSDAPALRCAARSVITFFYYDDLPQAMRFYADTIGLRLVLQPAGSAIFEVRPGVCLGLVDANSGSQRPIAGRNKGAILSLEVDDLDACLERFKRLQIVAQDLCLVAGAGGLTREFKIHDPGGYTIEFLAWAEQAEAILRR
jgi:catechol 2,3-dioxygenase-like lactoylglutathione lyase family enzyme